MKTGDILKFGAKKSVTLIGGTVQLYKEILKWMLDSCVGKGLAELPIPNDKPFEHMYFLRACANELGCDHLANLANKHMEKITSEQIQPKDVRALWYLDPTDNEMRKFLADHIAIRFFEKKLKDVGPYLALRKEIPDFDKAINDFCATKIAERDEVKQKAYEERKKAWQEGQKAREEKRLQQWALNRYQGNGGYRRGA